MMRKLRRFLLGAFLLIFLLTGCGGELMSLVDHQEESGESIVQDLNIQEEASYGDLDKVAAYIREYNKLPHNYISKKEAKKLGWDPRLGNLWEITDGKSIGGDRFMNYEEKLPEKNGRVYYECDIDYQGGHRGAKRLVYSNDGLIYYSEDHYNSFIALE